MRPIEGRRDHRNTETTDAMFSPSHVARFILMVATNELTNLIALYSVVPLVVQL
jgi:hypothetical protein